MRAEEGRANTATRIRERLLSTGHQVLRENRATLIVATCYVAAGGLIQMALKRPWPIALTTWPFASLWAIGSVFYLGLAWIFGRRTMATRLSLHSVMSALFVALLVEPVHLTFQSLKQSIGPTIGFRLDQAWSGLDITLHAGPAWQLLSGLLTPPIIRSLDFVYVLWFPGLLVFCLWCSWSLQQPLRRRAILAWLILWIGGGTVGAWAGTSAGPCYYEYTVVGEISPYTHLLDKLDEAGFTFARFNQRGVWKIRTSDTFAPFAGISAMPSMHVGLAVLVALVGWHRHRETGILLGVGAVIVQIGSVVLGWHYAIDGYAGAGLAFASWRLAQRLVPN